MVLQHEVFLAVDSRYVMSMAPMNCRIALIHLLYSNGFRQLGRDGPCTIRH